MSTEQRVQAYYRRYRNSHAAGYYTGNLEGNIYERMAQVFKMPIKEIRKILGRPAREPNQYGCRFHKGTDSCRGKVTFGAETYASEIMNDHTPVWMCEHHRHQSAMDI